MTDKEKIKAEIERLKESGCASPIVICDTLLAFIDSLQKEPVKIKKGCKYLCLGNMFNNDTGKISFIGGKIYLAPEDNTLVSEENGWRCDTSEDSSNFELVEEPVSEDLAKAAKENAKIERSDDTEVGYDINGFGGFVDGANWQKTKDESTTEDLGEYINELSKQFPEVSFAKLSRIAVRVSKWQKQQMMKNAVNTEVCHIFGDEDKAFFPMYGMDMKQGDKVKLIIIKEE